MVLKVTLLSGLKPSLKINRQQCVVVEGEKSDFVTVPSGVPQGSIRGPVLFLAYINDLPQNIRSRVRPFSI